jgi:cytochrome c553
MLAIAFLFGACNASAGPSSQVAWTPETLALVRSGNASSGAQLAAGCGACHGSETAPALAPYPRLAGQDAAYLYKQLRDFKDGTRDGTLMRAFASALSDQDMADIAAHYAAMPAVAAEDPPARVAAPSLALYGDGTRLIPACNSCHGDNGAGNPRSHGMPVLAGQTAQYLIATLLLYNGAFRENDVYQVMRHISGQLTIEEVKALSLYYASRGTQ